VEITDARQAGLGRVDNAIRRTHQAIALAHMGMRVVMVVAAVAAILSAYFLLQGNPAAGSILARLGGGLLH
jgi:hypothetical protein